MAMGFNAPLATPLLNCEADVENGQDSLSTKANRVNYWRQALEGSSPLLPQLPTDELGPVDQHREADIIVATAKSVSLVGSDIDNLVPTGDAEAKASALLVASLATLLGRYAQVTDLAVGLWDSSKTEGTTKCHPLRVSLLREPSDKSPPPLPQNEEENSTVTPLSSFTSLRTLLNRVSSQVAATSSISKSLMDVDDLVSLDKLVSTTNSFVQRSEGLLACRSLEAFVVLGTRSLPPSNCPCPAVLLLCPSWPPARSSPAALELRCPRGCFNADTIQRMSGHLTTLMHELFRTPDAPLCQISLLGQTSNGKVSSAELEVLSWADKYSSSCYSPNAGKAHWSPDRSMMSLIDEAARTSPNDLAILDDGTGACYSYSELIQLSSSVAAEIAAKGVKPDSLVPLMSQRCVAMVLGILGIIRTGCSYVPLDLHWPDDRLTDVLTQCSATVALASQECHSNLSRLAGSAASVFCIEEIACKGGSLPDRGNGRNIVYTFFTSGTTGKPKGVMVENRGLVHRIHWFNQRWPLKRGEAIVAKIAYTFGLSEWEIFWPLSAGATMVLAPPGGEKDPDYLLKRACNVFVPPRCERRLLEGSGPSGLGLINAAHIFVPSMLQVVFERYDELEEEDLSKKTHTMTDDAWWRKSKAREIVTCGEPLNYSLAQKLFSRFPHCGLTNMYGPTEAEMTFWHVPYGKALSKVSAGAPVEGTKIVLTDLRERRLAACLEPAEITFGGPFLARGYLGRPDLDAQAFVRDFTCNLGQGLQSDSNIINTGADMNNMVSERKSRLYLTGDLGRWREGGLIELLGRRDFQVKLRGFRIELGEIESACRAAGARTAICLLRKGAGGAPALVAYYEPSAEQNVPEAVVRASCQKRLPPYMQPQSIVRMDKLPRNTNGKVDRPKLPEPPETPGSTEEKEGQDEGEAPASNTQIAVAAAFATVLNIPREKVFLDSDFQDIGGTSLLAGRATGIIRKSLGVSSLAGTAIYKHPTVRRLAAVVDQCLAEKAAEASETQDTTCGILVPALRPRRSPHSQNSMFSIIMQTVGVFCLNFLFQSQAWSPVWWSAWFLYEYHGQNALFLYLPLAAALDIAMQFVIIVALKWLIIGKIKAGTIDLWSFDYYRWWFVNTLISHNLKVAMPLIADTPAAGILLRCLGAEVGEGARIGVFEVHDPDLLRIGAGATIGKLSKLATSAVMHGQVHLDYIEVGEEAAVGPTAVLSQGSFLPERKVVLPLSTMEGWHGAVGSVACRDASPPTSTAEFRRRQDLLRVWLGLPTVLILHTIPYVITTLFLEVIWRFLYPRFEKEQALAIFGHTLPWTYAHSMWISLVAVVIIQKWLLIGDFSKVSKKESHWTEFKHWLHARAVESHDFEEVGNLWVNSELLSWIYRLLGTRVGQRVQIDKLHLVENDCLTIGDYCVFGTDVLIHSDTESPWVPESYTKSRSSNFDTRRFGDIRFERAANILDHCTLLPGVTAAERSVLGTCTLAPAGSYYPPLAIHSGSQRGHSLHLRDHNASPALRDLEDRTMKDLDNPATWWLFNLILFCTVMIASPIPEAAWIVTYYGVCSIWDIENGSLLELLVLTPIVYNFVELVLLLLNVALKWIIMGRYKVAEHRFFGSYHIRWMAMMIFGSGISALQDCFHGTIFEVWLARACGAKIGKECYLAGLMIEYDLLTVGDYVTICSGCDTTGHTVENMVIKLATTRIGDGAAMLPGSFAMPGSVVEDEAVLMEHTQVLKGETVPKGEVWAGMPASACKPRAPVKKYAATNGKL